MDNFSFDLVISTCVINPSADKPAVFREIRRVLKPGGQFAVSDIVLLRVLPEKIANNVNAYLGCVAGASLLNEYILMAVQAGLKKPITPLNVPSQRILYAHRVHPKRAT